MPAPNSPNRDWNRLDPTFRRKLEAVFRDMEGHGLTLALNEGWRSAERQAWLYAQGRTRKGPVVTNKDGYYRKSYHQSGKAADVIFVGGHSHRYWPPYGSAEWKLLASSAKAHGLVWGGNWKMKDLPHLELRDE